MLNTMMFSIVRQIVLGTLLLVVAGCAASNVPDTARNQTPTVPAIAPDQQAPNQFLLYLQHYFAPELVPIDLTTLADRSDRSSFKLSGVNPMQQTQFIVSPDGSTVVALIDDGVRVLDGYSGEVRAQFRRPDDQITGVSPDGTRLTARRLAEGKDDWALLSAANGELLVSGHGERAIYDWNGGRIYSLEMPGSGDPAAAAEPQPVVLVVSNLETGREVDRLTLDGVLAGSVTIDDRRYGQSMQSSFGPSMALTPDRRQLALLHGDADKLTLVDVQPLRIVSTRELGGSQDPLIPGTAVRGWDMQFAPDGMLYVAGNDQRLIIEEGQGEVRYLGVRRINVEQAMVEAPTLVGEDWAGWLLAPDGSAIYFASSRSEHPAEATGAPHDRMLLRRLDPRTFAVMAERELDGFHWMYLIAEPKQ
jgi:hypothetical protein